MKKKITILGSTGTIGKNTLDVVRNNRDFFKIYAMSANKNLDILGQQIEEFHPKVVVVSDKNAYEKASSLFSSKCKVLHGDEGLIEIVSENSVDFVMAGIVGAAGLSPFLAALESNKIIGLANKEVLVMAGGFLHQKYSASFLKQIIPVDSEHSAIYQCMQGGKQDEIESILLTASGGPFRLKNDLDKLSINDALSHPNWQMGPKITIDSATLMNKGFELIEAYWLFPVSLDQIKIVIHPQSIIHSMVSFCDGSILAHLGIADMRIPIQYALSYPKRIKNIFPRLDFSKVKELTFEEPNHEKFPCLNLAFKAIQKGGVYPAVLNAANEIAVEFFLNKKIKFSDIAKCNDHVLSTFDFQDELTLENIKISDNKARKEAKDWICTHSLIQ